MTLPELFMVCRLYYTMVHDTKKREFQNVLILEMKIPDCSPNSIVKVKFNKIETLNCQKDDDLEQFYRVF